MSSVDVYLPLYRQYRPQQFSDLIGQEVVSATLTHAIESLQIVHAYLFCGPRGTGKTSSARIFAKSLNCQNGPTATPCQQCATCVSITRGHALDVTEIDAASNNSVEDVRELTDRVKFAPMEGKYKIYIIDEVHMLSTAAFNALLKTLEEPPPNVVFIFATTEPHKVLPTIVSRCQRFDFSRITTTQIDSHLQTIAQKEKIQISPAATRLIARYAKGGLRDALGLLDQVSVLGKGEQGQLIEPAQIQSFIGSMQDDALVALVDHILEQRPTELITGLLHIQSQGTEITQLVKGLVHYFRQLLVVKTCQLDAPATEDLLDLPMDLVPKLTQQATLLETEEIVQILNRLSTLDYQLKNSSDGPMWLEIGLLELAYRKSIVSLKNLSDRLEALEEQGITHSTANSSQIPLNKPTSQAATVHQAPLQQQRQMQPPSPAHVPESSIMTPTAAHVATPQTPAVAKTPAQIDSNHFSQLWTQVIQTITHPLTKALVKDQCHLVSLDDDSVTVGFSSETIYVTFQKSPDKAKYLEQALQTVLGQPVTLRVVVDKRKPTAAGHAQPLMPSKQGLIQNPTINSVPAIQPESQTLQSVPQTAFLPLSMATGEALMSVPQPPPQSPLEPQVEFQETLPPPTRLDDESEIEQAKKYTQELLSAKVID